MGTDISSLNKVFRDEYQTQESVRRYTRGSAGYGISYLLEHDYGRIYLDIVDKYLSKRISQNRIRLWEFGCGGGMNLIHLISLLPQRGIDLEDAYGTDFSDTLIEASRCETQRYLTPEQSARVHFCVARNENLIGDTSQRLGISKDVLVGSLDLMIGVNTIRYCHRLKNQDECAREIFALLRDGGICIIIDMNNKFPAFRSRVRDRLTKNKEARYLPSLEEHSAAFVDAGFEILRKEHFCWIPHSAGRGLTSILTTLTPALEALVPERAMRSLVIARKKR